MWQKQRPAKPKTQWDTDGDILLVLNATTQLVCSWAREDEPLSWTATIAAFSFLLFPFPNNAQRETQKQENSQATQHPLVLRGGSGRCAEPSGGTKAPRFISKTTRFSACKASSFPVQTLRLGGLGVLGVHTGQGTPLHLFSLPE